MVSGNILSFFRSPGNAIQLIGTLVMVMRLFININLDNVHGIRLSG